MFKLKVKNSITPGLWGVHYKNQYFIYLNGYLLNENFEILGRDITLSRAAKTISSYKNVSGKAFFKQLNVEDLYPETRQKLETMGLL